MMESVPSKQRRVTIEKHLYPALLAMCNNDPKAAKEMVNYAISLYLENKLSGNGNTPLPVSMQSDDQIDLDEAMGWLS